MSRKRLRSRSVQVPARAKSNAAVLIALSCALSGCTTDDHQNAAEAGPAPPASELGSTVGRQRGVDTAARAPSLGLAPAAEFVEDHRKECVIPSMPAVASLKNIATLPDPFMQIDGSAVTTREQWKCRREEIAATIEHYELGEKPRDPENVTGAVSGRTLTVRVADKGKAISFDVTITKPAGQGPFPAVIGYGHVNLGAALSGLPVATIDYTAADIFNASAANQMAKDGSAYRGQGLFYDLYGRDHSAGALTAWAWGVSRIVDALLVTPEAGIDAKRLAVTGCSRFGKGALVAGALDERIALTLPQEGGTGGCSAWRGVAYMKSLGNDVEQLSNVAGGTNWFRPSFSSSFTNATVNKIPHDHHQLAGLAAPRALLNVEQSVIAWLGPGASYINNVATREVFAALGAADAHTYSLSTGHDHCALPSSQYHWVQSYVRKYLLGGTGEASAIETPSGYAFERTKWINWTTPRLM